MLPSECPDTIPCSWSVAFSYSLKAFLFQINNPHKSLIAVTTYSTLLACFSFSLSLCASLVVMYPNGPTSMWVRWSSSKVCEVSFPFRSSRLNRVVIYRAEMVTFQKNMSITKSFSSTWRNNACEIIAGEKLIDVFFHRFHLRTWICYWCRIGSSREREDLSDHLLSTQLSVSLQWIVGLTLSVRVALLIVCFVGWITRWLQGFFRLVVFLLMSVNDGSVKEIVIDTGGWRGGQKVREREKERFSSLNQEKSVLLTELAVFPRKQ